MDWEDTTSICVAWDVLMDNAKEAGLKYQRVMKNMETGDSDEMISPEPDFLIGWKSQSVVKL